MRIVKYTTPAGREYYDVIGYGQQGQIEGLNKHGLICLFKDIEAQLLDEDVDFQKHIEKLVEKDTPWDMTYDR